MRAKEIYLTAIREQLARESRNSLLRFTYSTLQTFAPADFHVHYYNILTKFAHGDIKKLMVFMPPQHGKSEGSTRRLPAYILGKDPNTKVAIISYSAPKAQKFNREIQRVIDTPEYRRIFPQTRLNGSNVATISGQWLRNASECEIVGYRGGFKTVGVGGSLTGEPVDVLIMDDIYKDAKSAWSETIRESVSDWYNTVAETRLHNDSRQLIVFTRWHEEDLAGELLNKQGTYSNENQNGWVVVTYQAIKEGAPTDYDKRIEGQPLWPERHGLAKLLDVQKREPFVFASLYQQNPQPIEGLMYESFNTYSIYPEFNEAPTRKCYIDTADTGADYLAAIFYDEAATGLYVRDVLFSQRAMEYTEQETAKMLKQHNTQFCVIESNNGGRSFRRNVERITRYKGNTCTMFKDLHQTANKQTRIFAHSADVQNMVYFPDYWAKRWPEFYNQLMSYRKEGNNAHDDAADALTGCIEQYKQGKTIDIKRLQRLINR